MGCSIGLAGHEPRTLGEVNLDEQGRLDHPDAPGRRPPVRQAGDSPLQEFRPGALVGGAVGVLGDIEEHDVPGHDLW